MVKKGNKGVVQNYYTVFLFYTNNLQIQPQEHLVILCTREFQPPF